MNRERSKKRNKKVENVYGFKPFKLVEEKFNIRNNDKVPKARSGHRIVCDDNYLYSFGGYNPGIEDNDPTMANDQVWKESKPLFKELWKFNLTTREWQLLPGRKNLPNELASTAVILRHGKLMIYGGTAQPFGRSVNNRLYACDLKDGNVVGLNTKGALPDPQYGQALILHKSYLYSVGGTTGFEYTCDIHRVDLTTGIWEIVYVCKGNDPLEPPGRYRHELAFDGKMIYVLGGGTSQTSFGFKTISAFDLEENRWTVLPTYPDSDNNPWVRPGPRRSYGLVQYTDPLSNDVNVVISGGYTSEFLYNDVWRLNLTTLNWTCLKKYGTILPHPVYFHSAALTPQGKMYTFGGIIPDGNEEPRTDAVHSVWLIIPKLTEISWEAINFYHKNLQTKSKDELLNLGIPIQFIDRLQITN